MKIKTTERKQKKKLRLARMENSSTSNTQGNNYAITTIFL